jgi:hypothetical protein
VIVNLLNWINLPRWIQILTIMIWDTYLSELYPFDHVPSVTLYKALSEPLILVIISGVTAAIGGAAYYLLK